MTKECMLCRVRTADRPYYIEAVGIEVRTVEELLYYMLENPELIDASILNESLVLWMKDELRLKRLSMSLSHMLRRTFKVHEFVIPMFKEIQYPGEERLKIFSERLRSFEDLTMPMRLKKKAERLIFHTRYVRALHTYEEILALQEHSTLGSALLGEIYDQIGRIHAELFQFSEMKRAFRQAYSYTQTEQLKRSVLISEYLTEGREAFIELCKAQGYSDRNRDALLEEITGLTADLPRKKDFSAAQVDEILSARVEEYHRKTGM